MSTISVLMDEMANAALNADELERSYAWPVERVETPALVVPWPSEVEYNQTGLSAISRAEFPLTLVLGRAGTNRGNRDRIANWMSGNLRDVLEAATYTGDHVVTVTEARSDIIVINGVSYLALIFLTDVVITN